LPTSPSEATPSDPPRGRFTIVYLIHEAFRRDLGRLRDAARASGLNRPRAVALRDRWSFVDEQLHHHHRVEDDSLWPLVRPKLDGQADDLAVLERMEAQHHTLEPLGQAVTIGFDALAAEPSREAGAALAEQLDELLVALGDHLDDEESRCFPVVDRALTEAEFESFGKATAKAVGMRGSAQFFPWIFEGAASVERAAVLQLPPPPVRVLCQYVWEPRYRRRTVRLWPV
jgi:hypothetical protein